MLLSNMWSLEDIDEATTNKTNIIGYKYSEFLYLSSEVVYEKVCRFWKGQD